MAAPVFADVGAGVAGIARNSAPERSPSLPLFPASRPESPQWRPIPDVRSGMGWGSLFAIGLAVSCTGLAGVGTAWGAPVCQLEAAGAARVTAVTDGRSFIIDDGREIRLAAIEVPHMPAHGETGAKASAGLAARGALEMMLVGQQVELRRQGAAVTDR
jgi:endonuclease YncB( thermonuclease family)